MLMPFINLINNILQLYLICVIAWTILSTLVSFKIINAYQPLVRRIMFALDKLCEPTLRPIQKLLYKTIGDLGGIDISPIILILLINFAQGMLHAL